MYDPAPTAGDGRRDAGRSHIRTRPAATSGARRALFIFDHGFISLHLGLATADGSVTVCERERTYWGQLRALCCGRLSHAMHAE